MPHQFLNLDQLDVQPDEFPFVSLVLQLAVWFREFSSSRGFLASFITLIITSHCCRRAMTAHA
jgi:hypothetical protein